VSGMAALLFTLLGAAYADMQWGVTGGMSAADFDCFLEGVGAVMTGEYLVGELLMQVAEVAAFATAPAKAVKAATSLAAVVNEHHADMVKYGYPPHHPTVKTWQKHMRRAINQIKDRLIKDMNSKEAPKWLKYVQDALEWIKNNCTGPPPVAPV
jgi:hypothetical protein